MKLKLTRVEDCGIYIKGILYRNGKAVAQTLEPSRSCLKADTYDVHRIVDEDRDVFFEVHEVGHKGKTFTGWYIGPGVSVLMSIMQHKICFGEPHPCTGVLYKGRDIANAISDSMRKSDNHAVLVITDDCCQHTGIDMFWNKQFELFKTRHHENN